MMKRKFLYIVLLALATASAFAQTTDSITVDSVDSVDSVAVANAIADQQTKLNYIRSVYDKAVYAKNISSSIDLGLKGMGKSFSLDGKLQMRRDEVIRICITPFGLMEAARLEFTPTYVLFIDRIHKEYVKASYSDVAFLKSEGLDFFTLQSLFWNELFQPGKQHLGESDFKDFIADISKTGARCIRHKTTDILFRWNTDENDQITYAGMTYGYNVKKKNYSTVMVNYGNFAPVGVKQFPKKLYVTFKTTDLSFGSLSLNMDMSGISTDSDWEAQTSVSSRYTEVSPEDFFKKLGSM